MYPDTSLRLVFNEPDQIVPIHDTDVEVPVRGQNDAIHSAQDEVRNGHVIGGRGRNSCPKGVTFFIRESRSDPNQAGTYIGSIDVKPKEQSLKRLLAGNRQAY